jgi:hypothetical protein
MGVEFDAAGNVEGGQHIDERLTWALYSGVLEQRAQRDLSPLTYWRLIALECPNKYHSETRGGWLLKTGCDSHM